MVGDCGTQPNYASQVVPWKLCRICKDEHFKSPRDFSSHLKMVHCRKEGGSYICTYGPNGLCKNLPLEGVCGRDYDTHVSRYHVAPVAVAGQMSKTQTEESASTTFNGSPTPPGLLATEPAPQASRQSNRSSLSPDISVEVKPWNHIEHMGSEQRNNHGAVARRTDRKWTVYDAKVNMAALLNDPRPGKRQPDFFTKTWGVGWDHLDLSPSPDIPVIGPQHFRRYKKAMLPRVVKHKKMQANVPDVKVPIDAFPPLYTRAHDKTSAADVGRVPSIFHSPSFNLSDIEMFHVVFPWSDIESSKNQSQKLHQEKLSHYLDIIEVQIARQVALKSEAFFHVMSSHEELQSRLVGSTESIATLRSKMKVLDGHLVRNPLMVLAKARKKQRLKLITRKLKLMATLHQTQPTVQQLLSSSDYVGALDIISTAQEVLTKELAGIQSFRHLGSQLFELEKAINIIIGEEFLAFITKDLNKPLADGTEWIDEDKFTAVFMGLLRQYSLDFIHSYKVEAAATIKAIVKQTVISYVSAADTFGSESSTLPDQMRSLNFNKWLLLMEDIFHNLLIIINRVKTIADLMRVLSREAAGLDTLDIEYDQDDEVLGRSASLVSEQMGGQSIITEMFADKICKEVRDLIIKTCENANERCSKVVSARSKDMFIEKLTSHQFFSLMSSVERFAKLCDQICGTKISTNSVRGCLQGYNIRFINKFHEERKSKINLILDNERWRVAEIPRDFQAMLTNCELCEQLIVSDEAVDSDPGPPLQHVTITGQRFVIVGTVVSLLKMVLEYCTCLEDLPKSAPDILTKLIEILKLFNSRSSQLVLGAGALELVGLKTISAKNLALLQRSLELLSLYLPLIRQQFTIYLVDNKSAMLRHLDTLIDDYKLHVKTVKEKLKDLAAGMITSCVSQWEIRPPMPSLCFRTLCKQIKRFHEATSDIIEPSQLQQLFREVNTTLRGKLKERLAALNISLLTGPQQGLVMSDIAYFTENCSTLRSSQTSITLILSLNDIIVSR